MSLACLVCDCASSVPLVRQFLASQHHPDPFSVPLLRGEEAKAWVRKHSLTDIESHLSAHSSYAIIVGWDDLGGLHWADINLPASQEHLKAQTIVEVFA